MQLTRKLLILFAFCLIVSQSLATVKLPAIISDNMVLQGGMATPVWGWASPGEKIQIEMNGQHYQCVTGADGNWKIKLKNLKNGGPFEMTVKGEKNEIVVKNIMIGEVWLASGQSNMEFGIQTELNGEIAVKEATDSLIRFFYVPMTASLLPKTDIDPVSDKSLNGKWVVCSPENMAKNWAWHGFSAIGYYFAQHIRQTTHAVVGMIGTYKGGTEAQTWISNDGFKMKPELPKYLNEHKRLIEESQTGNKKADFKGPSNLYNAMIAPILPYGIRGVIWYQGESNGDNLDEAIEYADIFPRLINDWRKNWDQGKFPFLYVQLPNFKKPAQTPSEGYWAWVREAQLKTLALPNTGMAITIEQGEADNIHPKNKKEVGARLALAAKHMVYNDNHVFSGPLYRSMKIKGNEIWLSFQSIGSGLVSGELKGFGIAGADGKFSWAKAEVREDKVVVWSEAVISPVAVRYNWGDNPAGNLYNKEGLPASPFRTDKFEPETFKK